MKIGIVDAIDPAACKVRVHFQDQDGVVSDWLPVMQKKTLNDKQYWMPDIGEHVVCLMDDNEEFGVVIGAIYSDADAPPISSPDKYLVKFEDGTTIEYDRTTHKLTADVQGDVDILATGKTTWVSDGTIEHDGGSGSVKGIVQGDCICPYTGKPHVMISSNVKASK